MKVIGRSTLLISLLFGLLFGTSSDLRAATATVTLLPGRLTITDAPTTLTYVAATKTESARVYATEFSLSVTDATGSLAGWHIQAALGPFVGTTGISPVFRTCMITGATVATQTGRAPTSALVYPYPFRPDGDTIFSATSQSGMGKSSVTFDAEMTLAPEVADSDQYTASVAVTISSGP